MASRTPPQTLILAALLLLLAGCAGFAPVPGGTDAVNPKFYENAGEFLSRVEVLRPGMTLAEVFANLGRKEEDFTRLDRGQMIAALDGGSSIQNQNGAADRAEHDQFLRSLQGYRMVFRKTKRKHGFTSPIRVRTDEGGFDYTVTLIFRHGILYERPILSGGVVNKADSSTLFDYLNPGLVINRVR